MSLINTFAKNEKGLVINEVVASNGTGLSDEDGEFSDWVEIYNPGRQAVNLAGWSLTNDPDQPEKWVFPNKTLGSGEYLLVFASGKDRQSVEPETPLHTNFKLNKEGSFLGLYNVFEQKFSNVPKPNLPELYRDIAYGRYGEGLSYGYLKTPTPGEANDESLVWKGIVEPVEFSVERGFYEAPIAVELTATTPGAAIRYTIDGSEPTETHGIIYTEPIPVTTTTTLRATNFKPNHLPSLATTHTYIFLKDVLTQPANPPDVPHTWGVYTQDYGEKYPSGEPVPADYEMDSEIVNDPRYKDRLIEGMESIPTLSIVTDKQHFTDLYSNPTQRGIDWERPASVELIYPQANQPGFQTNAGLRIQGGEGREENVPKHSLRLLFKSQYGASRLEYPLFSDSALEEFDTLILRAGSDRSYAGNGPRKYSDSKFPSKYHPTTYTRDQWLRTSQIELSGFGSHGIFVHLYLNGLYWGLYNIVERPDESFMSSYFGGAEEDWYVRKHSRDVSGSDEIIKKLITELDHLNNLDNSPTPEQYAVLSSYVDVPSFFDYVILNWYTGNIGWPRRNWYAGVQNPDGKIIFVAWDAEHSWANGAEILMGTDDQISVLFNALMQSPDFRLQLADRMYKHLFNNGLLTDKNAQERWLKINNSIDPAIIGESARWGDTKSDTPITYDDWLKARDDVLAQMENNANRLTTLARQAGYYPLLDPPVFNQQSGLVEPGFKLTLSAPNGVIYYTTNGSDPRLPGGAVNPQAIIYHTPLILTGTTHIKTRLFSNNTWSALNQSDFHTMEQASNLRITEIMYNPVNGNDYEFIELKNSGDREIELANISFEGINFTFPPTTPSLFPDELIVLVNNPAAFAKQYPGVPIGGHYDGQLSNGGERLVLKDRQGQIILSVAYDDENGWPLSPDGQGDSLVLFQIDGDPNKAGNWRASASPNGSPGVDDSVLTHQSAR